MCSNGKLLSTVPDWIKAVRAMEILGILIIGGAGLCGFLKLFVMKTQDVLPKLAAALAIAAGKLSYKLKFKQKMYIFSYSCKENIL